MSQTQTQTVTEEVQEVPGEAIAVAGRDWRLEECGGHETHPVPTMYYMTPENRTASWSSRTRCR